MPAVTFLANFLRDVFKYHKKKILVSLLSAVFFIAVLFPYDDLSDVITIQVAKLTNNQVFLQFEHLGLDVIPAPGINLENVAISTPTLPTLKAEELTLSPSIASLLTFKPGFVARASGFMEGDITLNFKSGKELEKEGYAQEVDLKVRGLELSKLKGLVKMPVALKGKASLSVNSLQVDPTFRKQPEGDLQLSSERINLPASTVSTPYGPLSLPSFKWSQVKVKGRLSAGKLYIELAQLGSTKDAFNGQFKGEFDIKMARQGAHISPSFGAYKLKLRLNVDKDAQKNLGLFLSILDNYKRQNLNGASYTVQVSAPYFGINPKITPLTSF